jgi:hypothetical protein
MSMTRAEQRAFSENEQTIHYLARRLVRPELSGISSNAMLAETLTGDPVELHDYPRDLSDLARCLHTWLEVPPHLRPKMLWRLSQYVSHLADKHISAEEEI